MKTMRALLLLASFSLTLTGCGGKSLPLGDGRRDGGPSDSSGERDKADANIQRLDQGPQRLDWGPQLLDWGPQRLDWGPQRLDWGPQRLDAFPRADQGPQRLDRGSDQSPHLADQGLFNDDCVAAAYLSFVQGSVSVSGTTAHARNNLLLTTRDCTGYSTAGPEVFYQLTMKSGYRYRLELVTPSFNGALYLFSSCNDPAGTCGSGMGADQLPAGSYPEQILFAPQTTATYYIGVDGRTVADKGNFTLTVKEELLPANDNCAQALPLTLLGGYVATTGDTRQAMNSLDLHNLACLLDPWSGTPADTPGADLFYSVSLVSGNTYLFTATPLDWDYSPAIYLFTSCAQPKQTCVAGNTWDMPGAGASFTYTPPTSGTYILAVDSSYASAGAFTLEVKTPP